MTFDPTRLRPGPQPQPVRAGRARAGRRPPPSARSRADRARAHRAGARDAARSRPPRKPKRSSGRLLNLVLVVAAAVAIGGVAFAVGREHRAGLGGDRPATVGVFGGAFPGGSFAPGASGAPGFGGGGGFGWRRA